jgi:DNA-binding GntR family transcriptional regulator
VHEHEQMISALTSRDARAMRAVLVAHLNHKRDVVIEQLRAAIVPPANSAKA